MKSETTRKAILTYLSRVRKSDQFRDTWQSKRKEKNHSAPLRVRRDKEKALTAESFTI